MLDRFHLTLGEYARLTDLQIFELYLHPRKEDGSIDPDPPASAEPEAKEDKEAPVTLENELAILERLANFVMSDGDRTANVRLIDPAVLPELKAKLKAKYAANG